MARWGLLHLTETDNREQRGICTSTADDDNAFLLGLHGSTQRLQHQKQSCGRLTDERSGRWTNEAVDICFKATDNDMKSASCRRGETLCDSIETKTAGCHSNLSRRVSRTLPSSRCHKEQERRVGCRATRCFSVRRRRRTHTSTRLLKLLEIHAPPLSLFCS